MQKHCSCRWRAGNWSKQLEKALGCDAASYCVSWIDNKMCRIHLAKNDRSSRTMSSSPPLPPPLYLSIVLYLSIFQHIRSHSQTYPAHFQSILWEELMKMFTERSQCMFITSTKRCRHDQLTDSLSCTWEQQWWFMMITCVNTRENELKHLKVPLRDVSVKCLVSMTDVGEADNDRNRLGGFNVSCRLPGDYNCLVKSEWDDVSAESPRPSLVTRRLLTAAASVSSSETTDGCKCVEKTTLPFWSIK